MKEENFGRKVVTSIVVVDAPLIKFDGEETQKKTILASFGQNSRFLDFLNSLYVPFTLSLRLPPFVTSFIQFGRPKSEIVKNNFFRSIRIRLNERYEHCWKLGR